MNPRIFPRLLIYTFLSRRAARAYSIDRISEIFAHTLDDISARYVLLHRDGITALPPSVTVNGLTYNPGPREEKYSFDGERYVDHVNDDTKI